jgi:hypothetical protein
MRFLGFLDTTKALSTLRNTKDISVFLSALSALVVNNKLSCKGTV